MKNKIAAIIALLITLPLTACGTQKGEDKNVETSSETSVQTSSAGSQTSSAASAAADAEYTTEKAEFFRDGLKISGELLLPESDEPMPLVILSHGLGGNRYIVKDYAQTFAQNGIAAYIFDFIGGGVSIDSDGKTMDMSVLTEAADLNAILEGLKADPRFDKEKIFLFGESQGGFVSTYVACERPEDIAGLAVLYPGYVIRDSVIEIIPDLDNLPETMTILGTPLGRIYAQDALSVDIYDMMKDYDKKVLIIHGTADSIVPLSYSERAAEEFPDCELIKLEGADHGFKGDDKTTAAQAALEYVQSMMK